MGLDAERVLEADRDPQAPRMAAQRHAVGLGRPRGPGRVAGLVAGKDVEQQRGLDHRARQHPVGAEEGVAEVGAARDPAAARLEPDEPAAGRRDPQRAAAVVAVCDGHEPRRDRRGGAARRAAGGVVELPRVAGRAGMTRLRGRQDAELGQVRRPDHDEARVAQPAHEVRAVRRPVLGQEARGQVHAQPGHGGVGLHRHGHARERPRIPALDLTRLGQRVVADHLDEGVEVGVRGVDPPQRRLDHLGGGDIAAADARGQLGGRQEGEGVHGHGGEATPADRREARRPGEGSPARPRRPRQRALGTRAAPR